MRRMFLGAAALVACAGGDSAATDSATYGIDAAGQPHCDAAASTATFFDGNDTHEYLRCSWPCVLVDGRSVALDVTFIRSTSSERWAMAYPDESSCR